MTLLTHLSSVSIHLADLFTSTLNAFEEPRDGLCINFPAVIDRLVPIIPNGNNEAILDVAGPREPAGNKSIRSAACLPSKLGQLDCVSISPAVCVYATAPDAVRALSESRSSTYCNSFCVGLQFYFARSRSLFLCFCASILELSSLGNTFRILLMHSDPHLSRSSEPPSSFPSSTAH